MSIYVCDSIMGSGKSSAMIAYMNQNPDKNYVYISPFLDEARRIRESCPSLRFVEPCDKIPEYGFKKYNHISQLLREKRNIASTHQMFRHFKGELIDLIRAGHYTLVIDEAVNVFEEFVIKKSDINIAMTMGWIDENGESTITDSTPIYQGDRFRDVYDLTRNGNFALVSASGNAYYWVMSRGLFEAFDDVYVLTYQFPAQTLKYYFDMNQIEFQYIGVKHPSEELYEFTDREGYVPEYIGTLSSLIHIFDNDKLNRIGRNKTALSVSWYHRYLPQKHEYIETLRCNMRNFFIHYMGQHPADERMWSTFKEAVGSLRGKGFYNSNLPYNAKATNAYRHKRVLAYCVNIFMKPDSKNYFLKNGADVLEDEAALSTMLQWIWRSAIRDGKEIWVYIPSRRMRNLLQDWIERVETQFKEYIAKGDD